MTRGEAAWAAFDARREHGPTSAEYYRALRVMGIVNDLRSTRIGHCGLCGAKNHVARECPALEATP